MRAGGTVPVSFILMTSWLVWPRPIAVTSNAVEDGYTEEEAVSQNLINPKQCDFGQEIICITTSCVEWVSSRATQDLPDSLPVMKCHRNEPLPSLYNYYDTLCIVLPQVLMLLVKTTHLSNMSYGTMTSYHSQLRCLQEGQPCLKKNLGD